MARGRPTLAQQLTKAAESGDLEKVKELAGRLQKQQQAEPKKKPPTKSKLVNKEQNLLEENDNDENLPAQSSSSVQSKIMNEPNDFMVKARTVDIPQKFVDEDGQERTIARKVPFDNNKKRKNQWKDNITSQSPDIEFDKKTHIHLTENYQAPRREAVKKIKKKCCRCQNIVEVWPGEVMHDNYSCDACLVANKPI